MAQFGLGVATVGADYTATGSVDFLPPAKASKTVSVTVVDDGATEGDETVSLILTNAAGSGANVTVAAAAPTGTTELSVTTYGTSTLTIVDDENDPRFPAVRNLRLGGE